MITGWELALIICALTFMMVNVASIVMSVKFMMKFDRVFTKSAFFAEKMMDYAEKTFEESLMDEE